MCEHNPSMLSPLLNQDKYKLYCSVCVPVLLVLLIISVEMI